MTPLVQDEHGRPVALPNDVSICHEIIRELLTRLTEAQAATLTLEQRKQLLEQQLEDLKRGIWGRKSEKSDSEQLTMFAELLAKAAEEAAQTPAFEPTAASPGPKNSRPRRKPGGRTIIPDNLPKRTVRHQLPESQRLCPVCGTERTVIGVERSRQLELVPAHLVVIEHEREKAACPQCEGEVVIAEKPSSPIEKGVAGPALLAHVVVSKVDDHLPAYRQCEIFRRHGIDVARSTLCGWLVGVAFVLRPLYELMAKRVRGSKVIHTDETKIPIQATGKTHPGRMWVYVGDFLNAYIVYKYTRTKHGKWVREWLKGFSGFLQADAASVFDAIYSGVFGCIREVACWAHTRRKFDKAKTSQPGDALTAMAFINRLYRIEELARRMSPRRRRKLRRKEARPILRQFRKWLDEAAQRVLPKTPLGKAVAYTRTNWEALTRYVNVGRLSIDNNASERALRPIAIGRKNWLFAGTDESGQAMAILFSMVESAKRCGVNPETWLCDVLTRINDLPMRHLEDLLPDRWKQMQVPRARHAIEQARTHSRRAAR